MVEPNFDMSRYDVVNKPAYLNVLENPYFLQTLASVGEALDPEGVGGALGRTAKGQVSSRQAAKANAQALADANRRHQEAMDELRKLNGLTPAGQPGPKSIAMGPDGGLTIKIDPKTPVEVKPPPSAPNRDMQSSAPVGATTPSEVGPPYGIVTTTPPQPITPQGVPTGPPASPMGGAPTYGEITAPGRFSAPASSVIPFYQAPLRSRKVR